MNYNALAIESKPGNSLVLSRFLEKLNLKTIGVQDLSQVDAIFQSGQSIAVAIIDVMGFDQTIWDICAELKKRDIPMLILSPSNNSQILKEFYGRGSINIFKKPVIMKQLAECINSLIPKDSKN